MHVQDLEDTPREGNAENSSLCLACLSSLAYARVFYLPFHPIFGVFEPWAVDMDIGDASLAFLI